MMNDMVEEARKKAKFLLHHMIFTKSVSPNDLNNFVDLIIGAAVLQAKSEIYKTLEGDSK